MPDADDALFPRAVAAFVEATGDVPWRYLVAAGLRAALKVYDEAADKDLDDIMARCGFAGMDLDKDVQIRLKYAHEIAAAMVHGFDELLRVRGAENYVEQEMTATDPALEQAIKEGKPVEEWPTNRRYRVIIVAPGRRSPHELRRTAEADRDAALRQLAETTSALYFALSHATASDDGAREGLKSCKQILADAARHIEDAAPDLAATTAKEGDRQ
jgi:hypothetical protein